MINQVHQLDLLYTISWMVLWTRKIRWQLYRRTNNPFHQGRELPLCPRQPPVSPLSSLTTLVRVYLGGGCGRSTRGISSERVPDAMPDSSGQVYQKMTEVPHKVVEDDAGERQNNKDTKTELHVCENEMAISMIENTYTSPGDDILEPAPFFR